MAKRLGIAADLEVRKWELEQEFKHARDWQVTAPFATKQEAKDWLTEKAEKLQVKTVADGKNTKRPRDPWYGFMFEHDGPK